MFKNRICKTKNKLIHRAIFAFGISKLHHKSERQRFHIKHNISAITKYVKLIKSKWNKNNF